MGWHWGASQAAAASQGAQAAVAIGVSRADKGSTGSDRLRMRERGKGLR
jgi:hypothetical protein